jgi:oligo-1,6-glucosidase
MQWDDSINAGFSLSRQDTAEPWMRVHDDHKQWNVAQQEHQPDSVLSFWKAMLRYRKKHLSAVSTLERETGWRL